MKSPTVLVIVIVVLSSAILFWAYGNLRMPAAHLPDADPASVTPVAEAPKEKPKMKPVPRPVEVPVQAEAAAAPTAPVPVVESKPALPFPQPEDISIGADRTDLLTTYRAPTLRSVSNQKGNLVETYVYAAGKGAGNEKETWVVLRNGAVAAKFGNQLTPDPGAPEVRR